MAARTSVLQQTRSRVHIDDNDLRPAITVQISYCKTARRARSLKSRACKSSYIFESAVSQIVIQNGRLQVSITESLTFHFGIDMAIRNHEVAPTVIIHIDEGDTPPKQLPC